MAGIIEHGAGVAAGAQALAGGLQGMASGIMAGQELAAKKAELQQKRWMFRQAQEEEALREQQEQTQREWDALRAGLGPGTPESVDDVPPLSFFGFPLPPLLLPSFPCPVPPLPFV